MWRQALKKKTYRHIIAYFLLRDMKFFVLLLLNKITYHAI